jgi:hypothetical protein
MSSAVSYNAGNVRPRAVPMQTDPKADVTLTPPVERLPADTRFVAQSFKLLRQASALAYIPIQRLLYPGPRRCTPLGAFDLNRSQAGAGPQSSLLYNRLRSPRVPL